MTSTDVRPRLVAGAAAGAATGAALTLAEVASSLLADAPLPPGAWLFLAMYSIPALTVAGTGLALPLARQTGDAACRVAAALTWLTAFVYSVAVTHHDLARGRGPAMPLRLWAITACAVCALGGARLAEGLVVRHLGACPRARLVVHALLLLPFVAALTQSASALRAAALPVAILLVPLLATSAAVTAAGVLAWTARRVGSRSAAVAALALIALLVAGRATHSARVRAAVTDDGQPDARPHADWLRDKPNVVLIVLDTVRASSLSSYGYSRRTTPQLDAFAARAVRFTRATTVSPWSVPSHASLFTGLFPSQHGAGRAVRGDPPRRPEGLDGAFVTLAEALSQQGYATAGISANPLVAPAMNLTQGFRYFDARPSSRSLTPRYLPLLSRLKGVLPHAFVAEPLREWFPGVFRSGTEISDAATHWLEHRRPQGQPYLLFLNYMDAHTPYVPRAGFRDRWPGRSPRLPSFGLPTAAVVLSGERPITPEEHAHLRALYDDALSHLDHEVGRLLAFLEAQPDGERTWIIVTADHGEALGEHGRLGHDCVLSQQVLHVPLIIRYPRVPGPWRAEVQPAVESRPIQTVDVARLVFSTLGIGAAFGEGPLGREAMVATVDCYCAPEHPRFHGASGEALFKDGLKYVEEQGRPPLLFDIDGDPGEQHNLAADRPEQVDRLRAEMVHWRERLAAVAPTGTMGSASGREREEALRALGYVH